MTATRLTIREHAHHFLSPTLHPDFRRCSRSGCAATMRVPQPRPALAQERSETSKAAARTNDRQRTRMLVWQAFLRAGDSGLADFEGQALTGLEGDTWRPRRLEFAADNLITRAGYRRRTKYGKEAEVWVRRA